MTDRKESALHAMTTVFYITWCAAVLADRKRAIELLRPYADQGFVEKSKNGHVKLKLTPLGEFVLNNSQFLP